MDLKSGRVGRKEGFTFGDKFVEGVARLHEDPLALESEVVHVLGEQNFAEAAREWRLLLSQEWSRLSLQG